jgi:predicted nucleotidyltransferase component of viral defense system
MRDMVASIQRRLHQLAQTDNKSYQLILIRYFQERLIYRLSISTFSANFCLKGGAFLYALQQQKSRPTLDIDLLAIKISSEQLYLKEVFAEICRKVAEEDAVIFNIDSLTTSEIVKEGNYSGVRVKIEAQLGNIRQNMQIDIGFGDIVVPKPMLMMYPTLLKMNVPYIWAYSVESVIAEKFEAMIDLAETNSRMKDFYDIFHLLKSNSIDRSILHEAITQTFRRRQTVFKRHHPIFGEAFAKDEKRLQQWKAFLRKTKLDENIDFQEVMNVISVGLLPIYEQL